MWKRIISSNHYRQDTSRIVDLKEGDKGGLWGPNMEIAKVNNQIVKVISRGIGRKVDGGNSKLFWEHTWIGQSTLKE